MNTNIDNLRTLLENVRVIGFWRRLFGWRRLKHQLISANADLERLLANYENQKAQSMELSVTNALLAQKKEDLKDRLIALEADEDNRTQAHAEQMATLKQVQQNIQAAHEEETRERHEAELAHLRNMKDTWLHHQESVRQTMKALCSKHTIGYVDKVAFRGEPDNTVSIGGEYIVFDAKSPKGEDLSNFPIYIKDQAEKAKKYAGEDNVKKWIFFVVPGNTLETIKSFVYHLADYQVFVVTVDALEPILLSLKKIEEYEFVDQLSPDERENICRILGKFAHLSKRRIQVDTWFINQFMELAYKCESDLPADVLGDVIEFERAEKLNPPQERRSKAIPMSELEKSLTKVRSDASNKGISLEDRRLTEGLNDVPLYKAE